MSVSASDPGSYELIRPGDQVIRVGGQEAVVVTVEELRMLRALKRNATREEIEAAEIDADNEAHRAWVAAGRPNAESHERVRAELLAEMGL
jgi:hypothetical protein